METITANGTRFLKCDKQDCAWNIGYTAHDLNRWGHEFTYHAGMGVRVCNFSNKALAYGRSLSEDCPHKLDVCLLLGEDDASWECRFWGAVDPSVARRALGVSEAEP